MHLFVLENLGALILNIFMKPLMPLTRVTALILLVIASATQGTEIYELEPFYVQSWAHPTPGSALDGATWESRGSADLAELLESAEPGLALVRRGAVSNDARMRGLGGDDLSVTLDGRKIYCACANRMDAPLSHATVEAAERIEIGAGPFSLRRAGSLAGHINIISKGIEPGHHGSLRARYGSFDETNLSASTAYGGEQFAFRLFGAWQESAPYRDGSGSRFTQWATSAYLPTADFSYAYRNWHAGGQVSYRIRKDLTLSANYSRRMDREALFPGLKMDADKTATDQFGLTLKNSESTELTETWSADFFYNTTHHVMSDRLRLSSLNAANLGRDCFMKTDAEASNFGATFDAEIDKVPFGNWFIGGELERRAWDSDNQVGTINNAMLPDASIDTHGAYLEGSLDLGLKLSLDLGLRFDYFRTRAYGDTTYLKQIRGSDADRSFTEPAAFLSLRSYLNDYYVAFAGIGSMARAPNPQELYLQLDKPMTNPSWLGNPALRAPRSTEITTGLEYNREALSLRMRFFYSEIEDYIYPVRLSTPIAFQSYENLDARLYGIEFKSEWQCNESWSLSFGLAWQEGEKKNRPASATNDVLAEIPPMRLQAGLLFQNEKTTFNLDARGSLSQSRIDPNLNETKMGSWLILDTRVEHALNEQWTLNLSLDNIFNTHYALHNSQVRNPFSASTIVYEPGRAARIGLNYHF